MYVNSTESFDSPDRLNDNGTVTMRIIPSHWRRYWIGVDTYQTFTTDYWEEREIEYWSEETGRDLKYDDFDWDYDHTGILRGLSEVLGDWLEDKLRELGVESVSISLHDVWSPQFYNFTTDGFEIEVTLDPAELRALTPDFDVDQWARDYYGSVDGFHSYVPHRMEDDDWHAEFDLSFRIESLLAGYDPHGEDEWRYSVWEAQDEVYMDHVTMTLREEIYMESGYTLSELEEWSDSLKPRQTETLPIEGVA